MGPQSPSTCISLPLNEEAACISAVLRIVYVTKACLRAVDLAALLFGLMPQTVVDAFFLELLGR